MEQQIIVVVYYLLNIIVTNYISNNPARDNWELTAYGNILKF